MNLAELAGKLGMTNDEARRMLDKSYRTLVLSSSYPFSVELESALRRDYPEIFQQNPPRTVAKQDTVQQPVRNVQRSTGEFERSACVHEVTPTQKREPSDGTDSERLLRYCLDHDFRIFCDTCSILRHDNAFMQFTDRTLPLFKAHGAQISIPMNVRRELKNKMRDAELAPLAEYMLKKLDTLYGDNLVTWIEDMVSPSAKRERGSGVDSAFADPIFLIEMLRLRQQRRNVLVITQDGNLTYDLLGLNHLRSWHSDSVIVVKKLNAKGMLEDNSESTDNPKLDF